MRRFTMPTFWWKWMLITLYLTCGNRFTIWTTDTINLIWLEACVLQWLSQIWPWNHQMLECNKLCWGRKNCRRLISKEKEKKSQKEAKNVIRKEWMWKKPVEDVNPTDYVAPPASEHQILMPGHVSASEVFSIVLIDPPLPCHAIQKQTFKLAIWFAQYLTMWCWIWMIKGK